MAIFTANVNILSFWMSFSEIFSNISTMICICIIWSYRIIFAKLFEKVIIILAAILPRYQTNTYQLIINIRHLVCICTKFGLPDWKNKFWFCFCLGFLFLLFTFLWNNTTNWFKLTKKALRQQCAKQKELCCTYILSSAAAQCPTRTRTKCIYA